MEYKPKIIIIFGFLLTLILVISGSELTKQFFVNNRKDFIDNNIFVYRYNNDINYFQKIEPKTRIGDVYVDNNNKLIDNSYITQELQSIPKPIVVQNYYIATQEEPSEEPKDYDTFTDTNH
jgi:ABC-type antimicrobial peptide transport system permease subunit